MKKYHVCNNCLILSTFLLSLYIQLFLLNCQISQEFRKPVGNFPKEIWTRSLVYSGLVYYSGTTSHFARAERYDYFSRDSNIILLSLCHIHKHWALTKDQPKVHFQSRTKVQIKSKLASRPKRIYNPNYSNGFFDNVYLSAGQH